MYHHQRKTSPTTNSILKKCQHKSSCWRQFVSWCFKPSLPQLLKTQEMHNPFPWKHAKVIPNITFMTVFAYCNYHTEVEFKWKRTNDRERGYGKGGGGVGVEEWMRWHGGHLNLWLKLTSQKWSTHTHRDTHTQRHTHTKPNNCL